MMKTRPFLRTGLQPSHNLFTDDLVFMPRFCVDNKPSEMAIAFLGMALRIGLGLALMNEMDREKEKAWWKTRGCVRRHACFMNVRNCIFEAKFRDARCFAYPMASGLHQDTDDFDVAQRSTKRCTATLAADCDAPLIFDFDLRFTRPLLLGIARQLDHWLLYRCSSIYRERYINASTGGEHV